MWPWVFWGVVVGMVVVCFVSPAAAHDADEAPR